MVASRPDRSKRDTRERRAIPRLRRAIAVLVGLIAFSTAPAPASADSVAVAVSNDPTQDSALTITTTGDAGAPNRKLHVFVSQYSCSSSPSFNIGTRVTSTAGDTVVGSFSRTYSFTPTSQSKFYVCAFVSLTSGSSSVLGQTQFTPRRANAVVTTSSSADPTQDKAVTISVNGTAEHQRQLHVFVSDYFCSSSPSFNLGTRLTPNSGQGVHGTFAHSYSFVPDRQVTYHLCAFVERAASNEVDATGSSTVKPRQINATATVTSPATSLPGVVVPVTVSGSVEHARQLHVFASDYFCSSSPSFNLGTRLTPNSGDHLPEGSYSKSFSFAPSKNTTYHVCAFVERAASSEVDATGQASTKVGVQAPPSTPMPWDPPGGSEEPAAEPPVAAATLLAPANAVSGTLIMPTFTWTSASAKTDVLVMSYRSGSQFRPFLAVSGSGSVWVDRDDVRSASALRKALSSKSNTAAKSARYSVENTTATVRMSATIEPGRYSWHVISRGPRQQEHVRSAAREFTVHGPTMRTLRVSTRSKKGHSTSSPGSTDFRISTTKYATVRIELRRGGSRSVRTIQGGSGVTSTVPWSCRKPGGRYRYRVIARDSRGKSRSKSGTFRPVSVSACRSMRRSEQRAKAARQREIDRQVAQRRRAERNAQQRRINRYKSNCRSLGGTPRLIRTGDGNYWVCVSPWGGTMNVPH